MSKCLLHQNTFPKAPVMPTILLSPWQARGLRLQDFGLPCCDKECLAHQPLGLMGGRTHYHIDLVSSGTIAFVIRAVLSARRWYSTDRVPHFLKVGECQRLAFWKGESLSFFLFQTAKPVVVFKESCSLR